MNKDGWIRHRGGKCPVEAGTLVDVRYRDGEIRYSLRAIYDDCCATYNWIHETDKESSRAVCDIMAWRPHVATTEQSLEVEQRKEQILDTLQDETRHLVSLVNSLPRPDPIQSRDRILKLDAIQAAADEAYKVASDARTAERAELVQKLAGEGLALAVKPVEDMSDPRNWKRGDVIECVSNYSNQFTEGKLYTLRSDYREVEYSVKISKDDAGDSFNGWGPENFKWHSRPKAH